MTTKEVRVRIAPSPTGHLHLGTARTALYNYLYARKNNGKFIFRLEDTDNERSNEKYTEDIIEGLKWLGLSWDEGPDVGGPYPPYRQTEKVDHYESIANKLLANGFAYLCYATQDELAQMKEEQKAKNLSIRYDNRFRNLSQEEKEKFEKEGRIPSIRFRIEEPQKVKWNDAVKGQIEVNSSDLGGDMIIVKSNGVATYNFAVVVDDMDMKMSMVMRGEDHIHNTAKQLLLFEALGEQAPHYAHTALIFDTEKRKLSKRKHGESVHISKYREDGYMPEALVNYLAQMSWSPENGQEIFSLDEACQWFDIKRVSKSPAVFDIDKLNWFNAHYLRSLPIDTIVARAKPYLKEFNLSEFDEARIKEMIELLRENLTRLCDIKDSAAFFFGNEVALDKEIEESVLNSEEASSVLKGLAGALDTIPFDDPKGAKAVVDQLGKDLNLKGKKLYWPVRAALSGKTQGPDLGSIICILGKDKVGCRLEAAIGTCKTK